MAAVQQRAAWPQRSRGSSSRPTELPWVLRLMAEPRLWKSRVSQTTGLANHHVDSQTRRQGPIMSHRMIFARPCGSMVRHNRRSCSYDCTFEAAVASSQHFYVVLQQALIASARAR